MQKKFKKNIKIGNHTYVLSSLNDQSSNLDIDFNKALDEAQSNAEFSLETITLGEYKNLGINANSVDRDKLKRLVDGIDQGLINNMSFGFALNLMNNRNEVISNLDAQSEPEFKNIVNDVIIKSSGGFLNELLFSLIEKSSFNDEAYSFLNDLEMHPSSMYSSTNQKGNPMKFPDCKIGITPIDMKSAINGSCGADLIIDEQLFIALCKAILKYSDHIGISDYVIRYRDYDKADAQKLSNLMKAKISQSISLYEYLMDPQGYSNDVRGDVQSDPYSTLPLRAYIIIGNYKTDPMTMKINFYKFVIIPFIYAVTFTSRNNDGHLDFRGRIDSAGKPNHSKKISLNIGKANSSNDYTFIIEKYTKMSPNFWNVLENYILNYNYRPHFSDPEINFVLSFIDLLKNHDNEKIENSEDKEEMNIDD